MNIAHKTAPIQSMPSKGMNIGPRTGFTRIITMSIIKASIPVIIQCMYSHWEKNAVYIVAMPLSCMTLWTMI